MDLRDKNILILGLGKSGIAAAKLLRKAGNSIIASDSNDNKALREQAVLLESEGIKVVLGPQDETLINDIELVIVSPGVSSSTPIMRAIREAGTTLWSEIELAYRLSDKPMIAISGTNGKTTTTTLIGKVFEYAGKAAITAGNIGTPLVTAVSESSSETFIVEVSSFQLDTIESFRPKISVLINITEDHLDWHPDFADYVRAKARLFMNQTADDYAVLNIDDKVVASLAPSISANIIATSKQPLEHGVFIDKNTIVADIPRITAGRINVMPISEIQIPGEHNLDNIMAVTGACLAAGIDTVHIKKAVSSFKGLPHRIERVSTANRVTYFDDSKATNVDATVKALTAFKEPVVLMVGGRNKENSFAPLADAVIDRVRHVVGFGEAGQEILESIPDIISRSYKSDLRAAVIEASRIAQPGDVVLFSPACASFDAFSGYAERGRVFQEAVRSLESQGGADG